MINFDNYIIEPLEFDYRLSEKRIIKESPRNKKLTSRVGEETIALIGFFPTIQSVLRRMREMEIKKALGKDVDIKEAIDIIQKITDEFEVAIKDYKIFENNVDK